ncbi:hypothetical protein pb186bvf_003716 [Paramecium bursaria]
MHKTNYSQFSNYSVQTQQSETPTNSNLKGKLYQLEQLMYEVGDLVQMHRNELQILRQQKEELSVLLQGKTSDVDQTLHNEIKHLEDEVKREIQFQRSENQRIQKQLTHLKSEKQSLSISLNNIQKRVQDLEIQIGNSESN